MDQRTYKTILADPPWSYHDKGSRAAPDCKDHWDYPTMESEEIMSLPVGDIATENAHLYLWITDPFLIEGDGAAVCRAWGFEPKLIITWLKRTKHGKIHYGMGHYHRHATEFLIFAVRGSLKLLTTKCDRNLLIEGRTDRHSAKPVEQYPYIMKHSPGPYIELFARSQYPEWNVWGNHPDIQSVELSVQFKTVAGEPFDF